MADAGLLERRGNGPDLPIGAGKGGGDFVQNLKAGGVDTVVIGDENAQCVPPDLGIGVMEGSRGGKRGMLTGCVLYGLGQ